MGDEMLATLFGTEFQLGGTMDGLNIGRFKFSSDREDYIIWLSPVEEHINSFTLNLFHVPTFDTFSGHFTTAYINQLTQKTGSMKDFRTFLNMLKSALAQKSRSVKIEFLTTEEIQALKRSGGAQISAGPAQKCYILLSYCSEFDQVRYPIPLNYIGKLGQESLLECILKFLSLRGGHIPETRQVDREKDRDEVNRLLYEKRELQEEIEILKRYQTGEYSQQPSKEIKVLKRVVRNLEQDLMVERSQHKKFKYKKNDEYTKIHSELERLRASERTLKIRVKNLTEELASIRRLRVSMSPIVSAVNSGRRRSLSADRGKSSTPVSLVASRERAGRRRSSSLEKPITSERISRRQEYLQGQRQPRRVGSRSRTPSPRFDPTAYVREQTRKRTESGGKRNRPPLFSNQRNGHSVRSRSNSRDRYVSNGRDRWSHYSSASSLDSSPEERGGYRKRLSDFSRENVHSLNSMRESSTPVKKTIKPSTVKTKSKTKQPLDHSINLSDIDQRLQALKFLINDH